METWAHALSSHPDRAFARYICTGLRFGFRIGFSGSVHLKSAPTNMRSANEHPTVVAEYLANELARGRMLGPFDQSTPLPPLHINRFGVIPKGHNQGKWRLITDVSFPRQSCTRKELESLIGLLNHACKVLSAGRSFLRRMLDLLHSVHRPPNQSALTQDSGQTWHGGAHSSGSGTASRSYFHQTTFQRWR